MNIIGEYSSEFRYNKYLRKNSAQNHIKETENKNNDINIEKKPDQRRIEKKVQSIEENTANKEPKTKKFNESEEKTVNELRSIDRKVRQHEMAHVSAAAGIAVSGASFEYKRGPDGRMYAVGGEVKISVSQVKDDPEATIRKAEQIKNAALAPSEPSNQDRSVAAKASQMASRARMDLIKQMEENTNEKDDENLLSFNNKKGIEEYSRSQNDQNEEPESVRHIDIKV